MKNIFATFIACIRFTLFWIAAVAQIPIVILIPKGRLSVAYSRFFYWILMKITGIKLRVNGKLAADRPLLLVANHISSFEFATFPIALGASFFGKKEIESYPLVGWFAKKFGVIFISRDRNAALDAVNKIQKTMASVSYPMTLFPEGMTTTGTYIAPFKSSMFNFVENGEGATIQPLVMIYRDRRGNKIDDRTMSSEYADYDPKKQSPGELVLRDKPSSAFGVVFHIMKLGGMTIELNLLAPPPLAGMDRKRIAAALQKIISDEFEKLK